MKKTKIDQRIENALNTFFKADNDTEMNLVYASENKLMPNVSNADLHKKPINGLEFSKSYFCFCPEY